MSPVSDWHRALVALINQLRAEHDLAPLAIDAHLHDAAAWRAEDMVTRNYFGVETPPAGPREAARPSGSPDQVIQRFGYEPESEEWTSGENVLLGDPSDHGALSALDAFAAWRDSPPHLQNMLGASYRAIGIGGPVRSTDHKPMSGVCVVEFGSEVVAPVDQVLPPTIHLPNEAPPTEVRHERPASRPARKRKATRAPREAIPAAAAAGPLAGPIQTLAPWGGHFGCDWSQINQWDAAVDAASDEFGVPLERIKGHIVIESEGNRKAFQHNPSNGDSYGLMQIVPYGVGWEGWHADVLRLAGRDGDPAQMLVDDPALNVRMGAFILRSQHDQYGNWDRASSAFFLGNPNWIGQDTVNGNTGPAYRKSLNGLIEEIGQAQAAGDGAAGHNGQNGHRPGTGAALVAEARKHLGQPYVWATAGPDTFDCSGLVYYCYEQVTGEPLAPEFRDSHRQYQWGDPVSPANARPGDLVFYDTMGGTEVRLGNAASHVGIYAGGNDLINALNPSAGVVDSDLSNSYWTPLWIGTRRVLPTE